MSTIHAHVIRLQDVRPHPNADKLDLAMAKGWQVCVGREKYKNGDLVVYIEAGSVLPQSLAEELGILNYLSHRLDIDGERQQMVHRVVLRGEPSFGLVLDMRPEWGFAEGDDAAPVLGITKFNPPIKVYSGDLLPEHPLFTQYTEIEDLRSFPNVLQPGEPVMITEKIHGMNGRTGFVKDEIGVQVLVGSRRGLRARPEPGKSNSTYWMPYEHGGVKRFISDAIEGGYKQAIIYYEIFGKGVQKYGYDTNKPAFRVFDIMLDGIYVNAFRMVELCHQYALPIVPQLYVAAFDWDVIRKLAEDESQIGGTHGSEGVVVRPIVERHDPTIGRVVLKYLGTRYLFNKDGGEIETTDV